MVDVSGIERPALPISTAGNRFYRNTGTGKLIEIRTVLEDSGHVEFDELVADSAQVHIEALDEDRWWIDVSGIHVVFSANGPISVLVGIGYGGNMEEVSA